MSRRGTIRDIVITPVAFHDMPLLNSVGVHEPFALRSIIEVITDDGYGLGESYGDSTHLGRLQLAADKIKGLTVYETNSIYQLCVESLTGDTSTGGDGMAGMVTTASVADKVFSPFEVACLDIQGKLAGVPVSDLLGGRVRDNVQYSAYLFYKWAGHPGQPDDEYGAALDPAGVVKQAKRIIDEYGFKAIKLKGGVYPPAQEVEAIKALHAAFPGVPLRLDPNAAWTVETSKWVAKELEGIVEYLEDPAPEIEGMAAVAKAASMPLATNMAVVAFSHLPTSILQNAVQVVLSDHHFWGGLRKSQTLAAICATWGMRLSMHSNSHLGISLAAMTHLASATPNLDYACDTHWPWKPRDEDVVVDGVLKWSDGGLNVPTAPGLGVELDRKKLAHLHQLYLDCGLRKRDDTTYMRKFHPEFSPNVPKWYAIVNDIFVVADHWRRHTTVISGSFTLAVLLAVLTALSKLFQDDSNPAGSRASVAFIFLFAVAYSFFVNSVNWVLVAEIFPLDLRGVGVGFSVFTQAVTAIWLSYAVSAAFDAIEWKFYFVFVACNAFAGTIYFFFLPETRFLSLKEVAAKSGDEIISPGKKGPELD
ncbi:mandelate racemase/muconate lactonizing enzyme domain-containing protein [Colletotrichum paranaense]|uniref:glucarate dehydratase n=1 Tax=Colletotrichum paranaense TaxID=1914294 RepID=A0ABQ9S8P9_9PEZI|nr:mandelate racemase/muconate lactonizing enzyme domain-containing protein [Colletotrichum paranaense]KAK1529666.1 mandelate racemase/muconate lactonizing enzyme domain-containing protein [Colletotrichum paranaense]